MTNGVPMSKNPTKKKAAKKKVAKKRPAKKAAKKKVAAKRSAAKTAKRYADDFKRQVLDFVEPVDRHPVVDLRGANIR